MSKITKFLEAIDEKLTANVCSFVVDASEREPVILVICIIQEKIVALGQLNVTCYYAV